MKRYYYELYGTRALVFDRTRGGTEPRWSIATCTDPSDAQMIVDALNATVGA